MNFDTYKKMKLATDPELKKEYEALQEEYDHRKAEIERRIGRRAKSRPVVDWPNEIRIQVRSEEMFSALKTFLLNQKAEFHASSGNVFADVQRETAKESVKLNAQYFICYNGKYYRLTLDNSNDDFNQMMFGCYRFPITCSRIVFDIVDAKCDFGSLIYPEHIRPVTFKGNRKIAAVVAVSKNGVIAENDALIYHNPDDLKFVRDLTMGCPIIMGYRTFEDMRERALPGRMNILFARLTNELATMSDMGQINSSANAIHTTLRNGGTFSNRPYLFWYNDEACYAKEERIKELVDEFRENMTFDRAFIFGGADLYLQFAPYIDEWYVAEYDDTIDETGHITKINKYWEDNYAIASSSYKNTVSHISEFRISEGIFNGIPYTTKRYTIYWKDDVK